ncbi:hypothetical protein BHE74_00005031 [Ensete ventricosum]|nr:hypothetical protein GW17_00000207 [Ensete ventricosum]RWW86200.1 hypothetical protein BHE74_00005031 [Ensete ventricosum]RZR76094.1 hypothetical protein BHM03_00000716 [Ensete ventricosum]
MNGWAEKERNLSANSFPLIQNLSVRPPQRGTRGQDDEIDEGFAEINIESKSFRAHLGCNDRRIKIGRTTNKGPYKKASSGIKRPKSKDK